GRMEGTLRRTVGGALHAQAPLRPRCDLEPGILALRGEAVTLDFGSAAWAEALVAEINASSEYKNAAAKWGDGFNGNVLLVFDADASLPRRHALLVELAKGACQGASFTDDPQDPRAGFALRAPFSVW